MEGIVIRVYPYGEADLILRILTPSDGKLIFFARNAKKSKKRFAGAPDILDWGVFNSIQGKGRLPYLQSFKSKSSFPALRDDLDKMSAASFLCESFDVLIPEHNTEHANNIFDALVLGLRAVSEADNLKGILRGLFISLNALLYFSGLNDSEIPSSPSANHLLALLDKLEHAAERKLVSKEMVLAMIGRLKKKTFS